ncbi:MAG: KH domain-containing protein [Candidatus Pacearchaeota archaeon]
MKKIYLKNPRKIRENKELLEKKLNVGISISGKNLKIEGPPIEEYEATMVIDAFEFGFPLKEAIKLLDENMIFRKLPIKHFTRRKNIEEIRSRIIGREGKTKRTIEEVSGCAVILHDSTVGIIGPAEDIEEATTAITNLIKGSKQANVYRFLERMNAAKRGR